MYSWVGFGLSCRVVCILYCAPSAPLCSPRPRRGSDTEAARDSFLLGEPTDWEDRAWCMPEVRLTFVRFVGSLQDVCNFTQQQIHSFNTSYTTGEQHAAASTHFGRDRSSNAHCETNDASPGPTTEGCRFPRGEFGGLSYESAHVPTSNYNRAWIPNTMPNTSRPRAHSAEPTFGRQGRRQGFSFEAFGTATTEAAERTLPFSTQAQVSVSEVQVSQPQVSFAPQGQEVTHAPQGQQHSAEQQASLFPPQQCLGLESRSSSFPQSVFATATQEIEVSSKAYCWQNWRRKSFEVSPARFQ